MTELKIFFNEEIVYLQILTILKTEFTYRHIK